MDRFRFRNTALVESVPKGMSGWRDNEGEAFLGCTADGFPDLFMMSGPNANGGNPIIPMLEDQVEYLMGMIDKVEKPAWLDVRREDRVSFETAQARAT